MPATLDQLVKVRSQLVEEVLAYLDDLAARMAELPAYYPAALREVKDGKTQFDEIRQRMQVVEDRAAFWRWRAEERERLRRAGHDVDRLAYNPIRGKPEAEAHDARSARRSTTPRLLDWDDRTGERFRQAVILSDPGFGKTWLLKFEARRRLTRTGIEGLGVTIPLKTLSLQ